MWDSSWAKGDALEEILRKMTRSRRASERPPAVLALAGEHHIEMPITEQVNAILKGWKSPGEAIRDIMERP